MQRLIHAFTPAVVMPPDELIPFLNLTQVDDNANELVIRTGGTSTQYGKITLTDAQALALAEDILAKLKKT